jgi:succinate dehydrogenase flavin-adding protein (antitoxin of CptAB toxin-antitoxin module)
MNRVEREKLKWKCRRGLLELDLILHAFIDKYLERLAQSELDALAALLERPGLSPVNQLLRDRVASVRDALVAPARA